MPPPSVSAMTTNKAARANGYRCSECGWSAVKWVGRCGECQAWGTVSDVGAVAVRTLAAVTPIRPAVPIGEVEGGHVRIYKESELRGRLEDVGFVVDGRSFAHALHSPYWWLKCAVGVDNDTHPLVTAYHRVLVWDIMKAPALTRAADRLLNPVVAKSVVVYCHKPA